MDMEIDRYLSSINKRRKTCISTEHLCRPDFQRLLEEIVPKIFVANESSRIECNAPNYIIWQKEIPLGCIEYKNFGTDLAKLEKTDQLL